MPTTTTEEKAEKKRLAFKLWSAKNKEKRKAYMNKWRSKNKEKINAAGRKWWASNPEKIKSYGESRKMWESKNRDHLRSYMVSWREKNRCRIRKRARLNAARALLVPEKRVIKNLRNRLRMAVSNVAHKRSFDRESVRFLLWLAKRNGISDISKFTIDHIIPLSRINLFRTRSSIAANSVRNIRWLSKAENLAKGDKMPSLNEVREHLKIVAEWNLENKK